MAPYRTAQARYYATIQNGSSHPTKPLLIKGSTWLWLECIGRRRYSAVKWACCIGPASASYPLYMQPLSGYVLYIGRTKYAGKIRFQQMHRQSFGSIGMALIGFHHNWLISLRPHLIDVLFLRSFPDPFQMA